MTNASVSESKKILAFQRRTLVSCVRRSVCRFSHLALGFALLAASAHPASKLAVASEASTGTSGASNTQAANEGKQRTIVKLIPDIKILKESPATVIDLTDVLPEGWRVQV